MFKTTIEVTFDDDNVGVECLVYALFVATRDLLNRDVGVSRATVKEEYIPDEAL